MFLTYLNSLVKASPTREAAWAEVLPACNGLASKKDQDDAKEHARQVIDKLFPEPSEQDKVDGLAKALRDAVQALDHALYRLRDEGSFSTSIALKGAAEQARAALKNAGY
jgi:hypothetical protein